MKNLEMTVLFDFYRNVLTEKQADVIDLYYNEDLSLSEISEHMGITRQGVRDNIKRAEGTMLEMEEKLGLVNRFSKVEKTVSAITKELSKIENIPQLSAAPLILNHLEKIKALLTQIEE